MSRRAGSSSDPFEQAFRAFLAPKGYDVAVLAVAYQLYRASQESIARAEAEVLRPEGLSFTAYVILMALWMLGPTEVRRLAALQTTSKAGVVKALDALERRGLVRRARSAVDRRLVSASLTRAGRLAIPRLQHAVHSREHRLTSALTLREKRTLVKLLRKLDTSSSSGSLTG